jgi:hypothetical protein
MRVSLEVNLFLYLVGLVVCEEYTYPLACSSSKEEDAIQRRIGETSSRESRCRTLGTSLTLFAAFPCDLSVCVCCRARLERRQGRGDAVAL